MGLKKKKKKKQTLRGKWEEGETEMRERGTLYLIDATKSVPVVLVTWFVFTSLVVA